MVRTKSRCEANRRFVLRLESGHGEGRPKAFQWRPDSTYLITGGFGDIGLLVARAMAAQGARRLVLIGRTPLPPRAEWNAIAPESEIGRRIAGVRGLEALGVAVHIAAVDVSDETQLSAFLDSYRSEGWPPIRGVIHTAAVLKNGLARDHGSSHLRCANARQAASGTIARSVAARPRSVRAVFINSGISCPFGRRQLRRSQRGSRCVGTRSQGTRTAGLKYCLGCMAEYRARKRPSAQKYYRRIQTTGHRNVFGRSRHSNFHLGVRIS